LPKERRGRGVIAVLVLRCHSGNLVDAFGGWVRTTEEQRSETDVAQEAARNIRFTKDFSGAGFECSNIMQLS